MSTDDLTQTGDTSVLAGGRPLAERATRLGEGAVGLTTVPAGGPMLAGDRRRLTISGALVVLGLMVIGLGWFGAARSIVVAEQIPYVISGGLTGLALTVAGGFGYFSHWHHLARREANDADRRAQERHEELIEAVAAQRERNRAVPAQRRRKEGDDGRASGNRSRRQLRRS